MVKKNYCKINDKFQNYYKIQKNKNNYTKLFFKKIKTKYVFLNYFINFFKIFIFSCIIIIKLRIIMGWYCHNYKIVNIL